MSTEGLFDQGQYLPLFLEEAEDQLATLERGAPMLSSQSSDQASLTALYNEMHRAAHTLKGSARMLGYQTIGDLSFMVERLMGRLRDGEVALSAALVMQTISCVQTLQMLKNDLVAGGAGDTDIGQHIEALVPYLGDDVPTPAPTLPITADVADTPMEGGVLLSELSPKEQAILERACGAGRQAVLMTVRLAPDCSIACARVAIVEMRLAGFGFVVRWFPSRAELDGEFGSVFAALLVVEGDPGVVADAIRRIPEVDDVTVAPWEGSVAKAA